MKIKRDNPPLIAKVKDSKKGKWEPKKKLQFRGVETLKVNVQQKKLDSDIIKQAEPSIQAPIVLGKFVKPNIYDPIDMIEMLSQINVKVPLSKMFKIEELKDNALSWLGGKGNSNVVEQEPIVMQ